MLILARLTDVQLRLDEALDHLRKQQDLVSGVDCTQAHATFAKLLSNGLRLYYYLERQRNSLIKQADEILSVREE